MWNKLLESQLQRGKSCRFRKLSGLKITQPQPLPPASLLTFHILRQVIVVHYLGFQIKQLQGVPHFRQLCGMPFIRQLYGLSHNQHIVFMHQTAPVPHLPGSSIDCHTKYTVHGVLSSPNNSCGTFNKQLHGLGLPNLPDISKAIYQATYSFECHAH